jgi:hypothetical protein
MDAFDAHLEFMGGCMDDEVFGDDPEVEAEPTQTAMQWLRAGAPVQTAEDVFRAKFNLAPRRGA